MVNNPGRKMAHAMGEGRLNEAQDLASVYDS